MRRLKSVGSVSIPRYDGSTDFLRHIYDTLKGIQADVAQIVTEYNSEVQPILDSLPQGRKETRWSLPSSLDPKTQGLDGTQLFVDNDATSSSDGGRFWRTASSRPQTVREVFNNLYTEISSSVASLQAEISSGSISLSTTVKDRIGINIFDATQTSSSSSLDGLTQLNGNHALQIARDVYGDAYDSWTSDGSALLENYSHRDHISALLALHNGSYNSDNSLTHPSFSVVDQFVVTDYGAVGDGITDDYAAITSTIAAAASAGGSVYFPAGEYAYSSTLQLPSYVKLEGSGSGRDTSPYSQITYTGSGSAVSIDGGGSSSYIRHVNIERLRINGDTASALLYLSGAWDGYFHDLVLKGPSDNGIQIEASSGREVYYNEFHNIDIESCVDGVDIDGDTEDSGTARANVNNFTRVRCTGYSGNGWTVKGAETNTFITCTGESTSGQYGLQVLDGCSRVQFYSCYWEYNTTADVDTSQAGLSGIPVFHGCGFSDFTNGSRFIEADRRWDSYAQSSDEERYKFYINDTVAGVEPEPRCEILANGKIKYSDGDNSSDTSIYRPPTNNAGLVADPGVANTFQAVTSSSNEVDIDCADGWIARHTLTENTEVQVPTNQVNGQTLTIIFEQEAGNSYTVSFASTIQLENDTFTMPSAGASRIFASITLLFSESYSRWIEVCRNENSGAYDDPATETYDDLRALPVPSGAYGIQVLGREAASDGGEGIFIYSSTSTASDNDGTILAPDVGSGRWLRLHDGAMNILWFGGTGDGVTNNYAALTAAISALGTDGGTVVVPGGAESDSAEYVVGSSVTVPAGVYLSVGPGAFFSGAGDIDLPTPSNLLASPEQDLVDSFDITFSAGGDIHPGWFGATGDGSTDDRDALNNAASSASTGRLILAPGTYRVASALTLPADVTIVGLGGVIKPDDTITVTVNGPIEAGDYQIFDCSACVTSGGVILNNGEADVKWFGATGDGTTDDTVDIQFALDAGAPLVHFPPGTYLVDVNTGAGTDAYSQGVAAYRCLLIGADDITLRGDPGASIVYDATDDAQDPTRVVVLAGVSRSRVVVDDLSINSTVSAIPVDEYYAAIEFHQCEDCWIKGGEIRYGGSGIRFYDSLRCQADGVDVHHCYDTGWNAGGDSESCSIVDSKVQACGDGNCSSYNSRGTRIEQCYLSRAGQVGVIESTRMGAFKNCFFEGNLNPSWFAAITVESGDTYLSVSNELLEGNPNGTGRLYTADGAGTTGHSADTISVATSDDSFNDSGAGFPSDLSAGDVILTSGFSNSENNGYFEVTGTPTTSKITVTANLVDESSGSTRYLSVPPAHTSGSQSDGGISWTFVEDDVAWLRNGPIVNRSQAVKVVDNEIIGAHYGVTVRETDTPDSGGVTAYAVTIADNHVAWTQQRIVNSIACGMQIDYSASVLISENQIFGTTTGQETTTIYDIKLYDAGSQNTQGRRGEGLSIHDNKFIQKFINSGGSDVWGEAFADRHGAIVNTSGAEFQKLSITDNTFIGASGVAGSDYLIDLDEVRQLKFTGNKSHEANADDNGPPRLFTAKVVHGTFTGNEIHGKYSATALLNFEDDSQYVVISGNQIVAGTMTPSNSGGYAIVCGDGCSDFIITDNYLRGQSVIRCGTTTPLANSIIKDNIGDHDNAAPTNGFYDLAMSAAVADDGGSPTTETTEANDATANDMTLLPAVPAVDDAYYFGSAVKFTTLKLNVGTAGDGVWTLVYEYWDGDSWEALSNVTDETGAFKNSGTGEITFSMPTDWDTTTVNSLGPYYWVRGRVSAYTSVTTQPLGTQAWIDDGDIDWGLKWDGVDVIPNNNRWSNF